jgi:hypothetical protein
VKNVDDVISGPDLSPKRDPIAEFYEQKREEAKKAQFVLEAAIDAKAPRRLVDAIRDWRDDLGDTGD